MLYSAAYQAEKELQGSLRVRLGVDDVGLGRLGRRVEV